MQAWMQSSPSGQNNQSQSSPGCSVPSRSSHGGDNSSGAGHTSGDLTGSGLNTSTNLSLSWRNWTRTRFGPLPMRSRAFVLVLTWLTAAISEKRVSVKIGKLAMRAMVNLWSIAWMLLALVTILAAGVAGAAMTVAITDREILSEREAVASTLLAW